LAGAPPQTPLGEQITALVHTEPLAGRARAGLLLKGMGGRKGKEGERIEEGKNVAFHHLLLSNLTTGGIFTN